MPSITSTRLGFSPGMVLPGSCQDTNPLSFLRLFTNLPPICHFLQLVYTHAIPRSSLSGRRHLLHHVHWITNMKHYFTTRWNVTIITVACLSAGYVALRAANDADWTMAGHDLSNSRSQPAEQNIS